MATAVHAGHALRPDIAALMEVDDETRRREEDPFTDVLISRVGTRFVVDRSRFEVDLNRPRDRAVYLSPDDAWGLSVWRRPLQEEQTEVSLAVHDHFYAALGSHLDGLAAQGRFLVLDVHSYNHRRGGPAETAGPSAENPEVNVGTGFLDRRRWGVLVDRFVDELRNHDVRAHRLDVRENVRFKGGYLTQWVAARYPTTACPLAIEFKKVFMDEWTGAPDDAHIDELSRALGQVARRMADALAEERV